MSTQEGYLQLINGVGIRGVSAINSWGLGLVGSTCIGSVNCDVLAAVRLIDYMVPFPHQT